MVFFNRDFREFIRIIRSGTPTQDAFVYADPPYVDTSDNYAESFGLQDFKDLVDILIETDYPFAISEQTNEDVIAYAEEKKLHVHFIKTQFNITKFKTDILITNYAHQNKLF